VLAPNPSIAIVCCGWTLQFDTLLLLTIVRLVGAAVVRVPLRGLRRVGWGRILVVGLRILMLLVVVEAGHGPRGPTGAVEGLTAGATTATGGYAAKRRLPLVT